MNSWTRSLKSAAVSMMSYGRLRIAISSLVVVGLLAACGGGGGGDGDNSTVFLPLPDPILQPKPIPQPDPITTPDPDPITTPDPDPITTPDPDPITTPDPDPITTPDPDPITKPPFITKPDPEYFERVKSVIESWSEYRAQAGLRLINASSMMARGGTGQGLTVAVFDSGASPDHPDLRYVSMESMTGIDPIDSKNPHRRGHGTHVAGIIAARGEGTGMHGVAFNAKIASYALNFELPSSVFYRELGPAIDAMRERDIRVINNSWGSVTRSVFDLTPNSIRFVTDSAFLAASRQYVDADGIQVWATHNNSHSEASWHAGLPHLFPELEDGWIAVTAVGHDGEVAPYANHCGVAADWCLAAPGGDFSDRDRGDDGIRSTVPFSVTPKGYANWQGTSMAAPHVSGALISLKQLFRNLCYHQLRDRILTTANKTGIYADTAIYGQGLLDLDAATRPVGGTGFALGAFDAGAVVTTEGALLTLPSAAISRYLAGRTILVLDNYQRAPFMVPVGTFAEEGGAYLSMDDLDLARPERRWSERDEGVALSVSGDDFRAQSVSNGSWFAGRAEGAGAMEGMAHLVGVPLPHGDYRMADDAQGVTLGLASEEGEFYASAAMNGEAGYTGAAGFGIAGWNPESVVTASFVPDTEVAEVFGMSMASALERPMGWGGAGALALSGDSVELAYRRDIVSGETYRLGAGGRFAHLATESSPLVDFDDAVVAAVGLDLSLRLGASVTLGARLGVERPVRSGDGSIRVASSIDENGRIGYDDILIDGSDFLSFDRADLGIGYAHGRNLDIRAGVAAVRDGFGETEAIAGAQAELRF